MSQRKLTYFLTPAPAKVLRIEPEDHDSREAENDTSNASCSEIGKKERVFQMSWKAKYSGEVSM